MNILGLGPLELLIAVSWLILSILVVRRLGWVLGVVLSLTLVPMAASVLSLVPVGGIFYLMNLVRS